MAERGTRNPKLPPNYVTLRQLQELRLQEKQREVEEAARLQKIKQEEEEEQQEELRRQRESSRSKKSRPRRSKPKATSSSSNLAAIEEAPDRTRSVKPPLEESIPNLEAKSEEEEEKKKRVEETPNPKTENGSDKVSGPETVVGPVARRWRRGGKGDGTRVGMDVGGEVEGSSGSTARMRGGRSGPNLVNREVVRRGGMVWVPKSSTA